LPLYTSTWPVYFYKIFIPFPQKAYIFSFEYPTYSEFPEFSFILFFSHWRSPTLSEFPLAFHVGRIFISIMLAARQGFQLKMLSCRWPNQAVKIGLTGSTFVWGLAISWGRICTLNIGGRAILVDV